MIELNLNTLLFEYNILINLIIFVLILAFTLKNINLQNLFFGLVIYFLYHNLYAFLAFFHTNPRNVYPIIHSTGTPNINILDVVNLSSNMLRYSFILIWILILNFFCLYKLKIECNIKTLNKALKENKILVLFSILWLITSFYHVYLSENFYVYKFWLIKILMFNIFIITILFLKYNISGNNYKKSWSQTYFIFGTSHFVMFLITVFEFIIMNYSITSTVKCVSFADMDCVFRPSGSLFNPNTLSLYYCLTNFVITGYILMRNKLDFHSVLIIITTAIGLFLTASRSIILVLALFQFLVLFFLIFKSKGHIIKTLKIYSLYYTFFLALILIPKLNLISSKFNHFLDLISSRIILLPLHILNMIDGLFKKLFDYFRFFFDLGSYSNTAQFNKIFQKFLYMGSVSGRNSSDSTDNTFIMLIRDEGVTSLVLFSSMLLYFCFHYGKLYFENKNIIFLIPFCILLTLPLLLNTLNIFANFPIFIFLSIMLGYMFFIINRNEKKI